MKKKVLKEDNLKEEGYLAYFVCIDLCIYQNSQNKLN